MTQFKRIELVWYYVADWERAKRFYADVLEWPVVYADEQMGWIEYALPNHAHFAINRRDREGPLVVGTAGTAVLTVDDARSTTAALRAKGVRCDEVHDIAGVVSLGAFYDPDGNRIEFAAELLLPPAA